jgi:hypothetical protein
VLRRTLAVIGLLLALPYAYGPIYRFSEPRPFSGPYLLSPYENLSGTWQRANLHAHGRAWGGLTNGRQPSAEVLSRYLDLGYTVAGISNYHQIAAHHGVGTVPIYEHGYNVGKHHQLAIGARQVNWFDFPLWQSRHQMQFVLDRVADRADLVALAHPGTRGAYTTSDLEWLTGYQLIEVLNGQFPHDAAWDAALSSGHKVWGIGNDDNHDLEDPDRLQVAWTMIDAPSPSTADIVKALGAGRAYAVVRTTSTPAPEDMTLAGASVIDQTLIVGVLGGPATFTFIGQNGITRKTVAGTLAAEYRFEPHDTYIRTTIRSDRSMIYLNPVVRHDGDGSPLPAAPVDAASTWLLRGSFAAGGFLLVHLAWRRPRTRPSSAEDGLRDITRETA